MVNKRIASMLISILMIVLLAGCSSITSKDKSSELANSQVQGEETNIKSSKIHETNNKGVAPEVTENNIPTSITDINTNTPNNTNDKTEVIEIQSNSIDKKIATENKDEDKNNQEVSSIINKGNKKKLIVIDAGHGGKVTSEKEPVSPGSKTLKAKNVSGASGITTRTPEHVITLNVALKLEKILINNGYTVIMTRKSSSQTIGNIERAEIGNKNNADLVIRIHADSSTNTSARGASMLVPGEVGYAKDISTVSKRYGEIILKTLVGEVGMKNRGIVTRTDLTGFNWSKKPVVLIEMGFLSNSEEDKLLSSDGYQDKLALALSKGIEKAIGN